MHACMHTYIHRHTLHNVCSRVFLSHLAGVYPGVMTKSKWLGSKETEQWELFVDSCKSSKIKDSVDKVPNWARRSLGVSKLLGRSPSAFPIELQHRLDEILLHKLSMGIEISPIGIADCIKTLIEEYNKTVREVTQELKDAVESGEINQDNAAKIPDLALGTLKLTKGNLESLTMRFAQKFHWTFTKNEKPGKHLYYNDPAVVRIRDFIKDEVAQSRVHPRLVANWDQVWTLSYEPLRRVAYKRKENLGQRPLEDLLPRKAEIVKNLREAAGLSGPLLGRNLDTYIHTYIHRYTYIHTCILTCLLTDLLTYLFAFLHTYI